MNELTKKESTRLRRRSFFDSSDPEFTANVASLSEEVHGSTSFSESATSNLSFDRSPRSWFSKWLAWFRLQWQLMVFSSRNFFLKTSPSSASSSCLTRSYTIGWIWLGSLGLLLFQVVAFLHYQHQIFHLEVEECQFQSKMLTSSSLSPSWGSLNVASATAWTKFARRLSKSLAVQSSFGPLDRSDSWSCIALVPSAKPQDLELAKKLALFLPHSQLVLPTDLATSKSRLRWFIGHHVQAFEATPTSTSAVSALLSPLDHLQKFLSAERSIEQLPQVFLAQNQFEMAQLKSFREHFAQPEPSLVEVAAAEAPAKANAREAPDFGILLLKSSLARDLYDRRVPKQWDSFLHVITPSQDLKTTRLLLDVWRAHPEWPPLVVRQQAQQEANEDGLSLHVARTKCEQLDPNALSSSEPNAIKTTPPQNIDFSCDEMTRQQMVHFKNQFGVHLFPSVSQEETQVPLLESLAVGAVVLVQNSPSVADFTRDKRCLGVGAYDFVVVDSDRNNNNQQDSEHQMDSLREPTLHLQKQQVLEGVETLLAMETHVKITMGRAARVAFLERHTHFLSLLAALDKSFCAEEVDELELDTPLSGEERVDWQLDRLARKLAPLQPFLY